MLFIYEISLSLNGFAVGSIFLVVVVSHPQVLSATVNRDAVRLLRVVFWKVLNGVEDLSIVIEGIAGR